MFSRKKIIFLELKKIIKAGLSRADRRYFSPNFRIVQLMKVTKPRASIKQILIFVFFGRFLQIFLGKSI